MPMAGARAYWRPRQWAGRLARACPRQHDRSGQEDIQALARRVGRLEERLAAALPALSAASAQRSDDLAVHHVTARRYRQFLDQDLMGALHGAGAGSRPIDEDEAAQTARDICSCLFALPVVTAAALDDLLRIPAGGSRSVVDRLVGVASQLRADTAGTRTFPWHFSCVPGTRLDPGYQDPWRNCEPSAPACWVVAPAYLADGQVIVKQRVYTRC
jgi:hypothetical protein